MPNPIPNDDTHIGYLSNPSGLKKASGDSSSGVDAATLNAVAANLVVNGMIDLSALRMLESNTLSKLNVDNTASLKSGKGEQGRSEKISELALGVSSTNFPSMKVDSLGDIMFELMVLMIQSTTERRQLEREMRTTLTVAQVDQSKEIAKDIMKKMEMDVGQMKMEAWGQFAIAATGATFTAVAMKLRKSGKGVSVGDKTNNMSKIAGYGRNLQSLGKAALPLITLDHVEESANLEASIMRKQTALKLIKSIASTVESSLKDIDSTREHFMSLLSQIIQATHDATMRITRNAVI